MREHWLVLLVACVAGWIISSHVRIARGVRELTVEPSGYRELVNRGLGGKLRLGQITPAPTPAAHRTPVTGEAADSALDYGSVRVEVPTEDLGLGDAAFIGRSFLLDDVLEPRRFRETIHGRLALLPGFRRRPLPFSELARWRGRIMFRHEGDQPVLYSRTGRIVQFAPGRAPLPLNPLRVSLDKLAVGEDPVTVGEHFQWMVGIEAAFSLHAVPAPGATSIVLSRPRHAVGNLWHNGESLTGFGVLRSVVPGDWLVFEWGRAKDVFYLQRGRSGVISEFRSGREGLERVFPPSHGIESLARELSEAIDQSLLFLANASALSPSSAPARKKLRDLQQIHVRLTIDAVLQSIAQDLLGSNVHRAMPRHGWKWDNLPRIPPRAALVVVDLNSAELLAAASYPTDAHIEDHLQKLRRRRAQPRNGRALAKRLQSETRVFQYVEREVMRRRGQLAHNHAFDHHQVGSAIKPLFAAAVALHWTPASPYPDPLALKVDCNGPVGLDGIPQLVQGTDIPMAVYGDVLHGKGVTFRKFITDSCNTFMFRVGALALQQTSGFDPSLCGSLGTLLGREEQWRPGGKRDVDRLNPLARFAWLTGARPKDPETAGVGLWNQSLWEPLSSQIKEALAGELKCDQELATSLGPVSPEVVNLDLTSVQTCHPHFSSLLKGGGRNRWNNADLAVAYSRFITGRALTGSIVRETLHTPTNTAAVPSNSGRSPARGFDPHDCRQSVACGSPPRYDLVRQEVMAGMTQVLSTGTAKTLYSAMRSALAEFESATGSRWGAYAKTGTSEVPIFLAQEVDETLSRVIHEVERTAPEANFTLVFVRCRDSGTEPRPSDRPLGCAKLPALGEPVEGYALHAWVEKVPKFDGGSALSLIFGTADARTLFRRLAQRLGERS